MVYRGQQGRTAIPGVAPCIVARVAPGWRYLPRRQGFRNLETDEFVAVEGLPPSTRVEARYPDLARAKPDGLSEEDRELARYLQFVFHPRARLDKHLARIRGWTPITEAYIVPTPELPGPDGVTVPM